MSLIKMMSSSLGIDETYIISVASNSKRNYSYYDIPKRDGTQRKVYHPSPVLKTLQYWLVNKIFNKCKVSNHSFAYSKGCSIKNNAEFHKDNNYILHMDIEKYFESITKSHIINMIHSNKAELEQFSLDESDIKLINSICLYGTHLVIGSVCAPRISNCVMYNFDIELNELLAKYGHIKYTRYADDIIISSKNYLNYEIVDVVNNLLVKYNFKVNHSKTRFMSMANRRKITGLILDKNRVSVGFKMHKEIKQMLYQKLIKNIGNSRVILGYLYFLKDIEPEYFNKIIIKYSYLGDVLEVLKSTIIYEEKIEAIAIEEVAVVIS
jgi:RNA-directed DNA polymerase